MSAPSQQSQGRVSDDTGLTALAARFAIDRGLPFSAEALAIAKFSMADWASVTFAGRSEPVSSIVRAMVAAEGGAQLSTVAGLAHRVPPRAAALANGACSHALDYDDTHFDYVGHPSVAVLPAALAVAEQRKSSGMELLRAYLVGVEATCRIGAYFGRRHYNAGFHQTATAGAFGATVASARLLELSEAQTRHALGLVATRTSGLKVQFGSMGKPYHAGMAAANGVEAATLAALGFESRADGLECAGGFAETHQAEGGPAATVFAGLPEHFRFTQVKYKFHACCHGIHPALQALLELKRAHRLSIDDVVDVTITINPQWLKVCCIPTPRTGLEAKFSIGHVAALALAGVDTAALDSFSEENCADHRLVRLAQRVRIIGDASLPDTASRVEVETSSQRLSHAFDLNTEIDLASKAARLRAKSAALMGEVRAARLWNLVESIDEVPGAELGTFARALLFGDDCGAAGL